MLAALLLPMLGQVAAAADPESRTDGAGPVKVVLPALEEDRQSESLSEWAPNRPRPSDGAVQRAVQDARFDLCSCLEKKTAFLVFY